ncbi:MAG: DUF4010 domain-containing protein [Proteobacteria bacterium]|nr:DUF4010 domain-containing protein [Pseudomonadota bacterium]
MEPQRLLTALGIGLMIGVVRERTRSDSGNSIAGIRTHSLLALVAGVAISLGIAVFTAVLVLVGGLAIAAYLRSAPQDRGLTSEVAVLGTVLLAGFAQHEPLLAAALAVVTAGLLYAKLPLHRFARDVLSAREVEDALLLAGSALVVLPWLPSMPVDPWGVLVPARLWRLVVLVMAVGMMGEVARRAVGARWGYAVAGFCSGFASSLAVVGGFGHRVRLYPALLLPAVSAALLANLASLLLMAAVLGTASPALLAGCAWPLLAMGVVLALAASPGIALTAVDAAMPGDVQGRSFRLSQALWLAAAIAVLLLLAAWLRQWLGVSGALLATMVVALAEVHAAVASLAQLFGAQALSAVQSQWGLIAVLACASLAKVVLAGVTGGRAYALRIGGGLGLGVLAAAVTLWLQQRGSWL